MSCLIHCKRCGSTDGTAFTGMCPECMHKALHEAFEADREEAAKHAAHATCETLQARTIRRLRALADGYRAKVAPSYATRRKAEAYDRIAKHFKVYDQWAVNYERTVAIAIVAADVRDEATRTRDEAVQLAQDAAREERARIVARLRELAGEYGEGETELYVLQEAADTIESEEP